MTENSGGVPQIFDSGLIRTRLARAAGVENFYIDHLIVEALDRLSPITRDFAHALVIVPDPEAIDTARLTTGQIKKADIVPVFADGETLQAPSGDYDLVLALGCLQAINDLPGMLTQIKTRLVPDGLFMAAMIGGQSLSELRQSFLHAEMALRDGAAPRVAPFADVRDAGSLLQRAGFALPVADLDRLTVRYDSMIELAMELRRFSASNPLQARDKGLATRTLIAAAGQHYAENFSDADGRIRATLETIWMSGWSPHESQQKPLKPGTAKMRLADALNTSETKI